jgi:hypothetical protein
MSMSLRERLASVKPRAGLLLSVAASRLFAAQVTRFVEAPRFQGARSNAA